MPSDIVFTASTVGQLLTYIAPGFLAFEGYRLRYPGPERSAGAQVVISVVLSLPLLALVNGLLPGSHKVTHFGYVLVLLLSGVGVGYLCALVRGTKKFKKAVGFAAGYRREPESSIYAQTLLAMSEEATVVMELRDGRKVWGCPRKGPLFKDDGINEVYLVYPRGLAEGDTEWVPLGPGVIVPLAEVSTIVLSEDPSDAPPAPSEGASEPDDNPEEEQDEGLEAGAA